MSADASAQVGRQSETHKVHLCLTIFFTHGPLVNDGLSPHLAHPGDGGERAGIAGVKNWNGAFTEDFYDVAGGVLTQTTNGVSEVAAHSIQGSRAGNGSLLKLKLAPERLVVPPLP